MRRLVILACLFLAANYTYAQNVGIGDVSFTPDASAMLEVQSTSKGMLVPRMTEAQRSAIANPATGLLVYQTDNSAGFYYHNGTVWTTIANASLWQETANQNIMTSRDTVFMYGSNGRLSAIVTNVDSVGNVDVFGPNGNYNAYFGFSSGNGKNNGMMGVCNPDGIPVYNVYANDAGGYGIGRNRGNFNVSYIGTSLDQSGLQILSDSLGNAKIYQGVFKDGNEGFAYLQNLGLNGAPNVVLEAMGGNRDYGYIAVRNELGQDRVAHMIDEVLGFGEIETYGPNGSSNIFLHADGANADLGAFALRNELSYDRVQMGVNNSDGGGIYILKPNGMWGVRLESEDSVGVLNTYSPNSSSNSTLSYLFGNKNMGYFSVNGESSNRNATMLASDDGGQMFIHNTAGNFVGAMYTANTGVGLINTYDSLGVVKTNRGATGATGAGYLNTFGANGSVNCGITVYSGVENHGYMYVADDAGTLQAGMYADGTTGDGTIFADVKNFRMEHPTQEGKEIWYAAIEGPEAAAYERGSATLVNGKVNVEFSEHFQLVASQQNVTITLTPKDASSKGLAVVKETAQGFEVKELSNGQGNYGFYWEVRAVRKGYENYQVIRDEKKVALPSTSTPVAAQPVEAKRAPSANVVNEKQLNPNATKAKKYSYPEMLPTK